MTIQELIDQLQDIADSHDEGADMTVRLAQQPRWSFEYRISTLGVMPATKGQPAVCYIAEGEQVGYLPGAAAVAIGWQDASDEPDDLDDGSSSGPDDDPNPLAEDYPGQRISGPDFDTRDREG